MTDQPSTVELVQAVRGFIEDHAMTQLTGHAAFHARVAANVLAIVERELIHGADYDKSERERLVDLLKSDGDLEALNRELCARIRSGELTPETPGLVDHLWQTTIDKVSIDQPKYAAYREALKPST